VSYRGAPANSNIPRTRLIWTSSKRLTWSSPPAGRCLKARWRVPCIWNVSSAACRSWCWALTTRSSSILTRALLQKKQWTFRISSFTSACDWGNSKTIAPSLLFLQMENSIWLSTEWTAHKRGCLGWRLSRRKVLKPKFSSRCGWRPIIKIEWPPTSLSSGFRSRRILKTWRLSLVSVVISTYQMRIVFLGRFTLWLVRKICS